MEKMKLLFEALVAAFAANPEVLWPLVGALFVLITKPRTAEQKEKLAEKWYGPYALLLIEGLAAAGLDPVRLVQIVRQFIEQRSANAKTTNSKRPPPMPPGVGVLLLVVGLGAGVSGCAFFDKHAKSVLDLTQIACIIANQALPESNVARVCDVVDDLLPPMRKVLAESRAASAKVAAEAKASACGPVVPFAPDAGAK